MFEIVKAQTRGTDRQCFNQLVRFLADCARVHPMPEEDQAAADRLLPMTKALLGAWYEEPHDYLGQLFGEKDCAIDEMGQLMTPPWIVSYINDAVLEEAEEEDEARRKLVLDPCTGTGRFLVDLALRHRDKGLALFGVELDLDLYRACLVNLRLFALGMPYFVLRGDALIVDLKPSSPNWGFANRWEPPDWQEAMTTSEGETFAAWRKERGFEEEPSRREIVVTEKPEEELGDLPLFGKEE
jgi:hypothetical protein